MRVAVGVCGLGYGHSLRQSAIVRALHARGHSIGIFGSGSSLAYFRANFPQHPCFEVVVPWIPCGQDGFQFGAAAAHPWNREPASWSRNFAAMDAMTSALGGPPNLVISDCCPVTAWYAYATGGPLVTLDNQSKFLGYEFPDVNGFSRQEERARSRFFYPQAEARLATTFFKVPYPRDPQYQVTLFSTIQRRALETLRASPPATEPRLLAVYLSPYGATRQTVDEILPLLLARPRYRFFVFARETETIERDNIRVTVFDENFLEVLARSCGVVTNAGSNVLCEALSLGKPVLAIPFATFEQNYNASVVDRHGFGLATERLGDDIFDDFLKNLPDYALNLQEERSSERVLLGRNGLSDVVEHLTDRFRV
jgi:uncharacterized protein (TIGR00661 family)